MGGWMDGKVKSGFKEYLQQSKNTGDVIPKNNLDKVNRAYKLKRQKEDFRATLSSDQKKLKLIISINSWKGG